MRTKVSAICDKTIEAGWLLALVVVPLFFNVYSNRVFEPDKLGLLRSIATLMAVAWLIKLAEEGFGRAASARARTPSQRLDRFLRTPLVAPTLLLALVYLLATVTSVVPRTSFWGSYQRLQGTYSTLSYMVIFFLMLQSLRRREQLRRLLTTIILTSLPIALYGLLQHYRLDPLPWGGDVTFRVASNMGNAIFIGAYLIMIVPITLASVVEMQTTALGPASPRAKVGFGVFFWLILLLQLWAWAALSFERGLATGLLVIVMLVLVAAYLRRPVARFLLLGAYGLILTVQLVCILFSQSRGPLLGIAGGLFFFALLYTFIHRWRKATVALTGLSLALLLFLVLINLPKSPLAAIRDVPYIGRFGRVFETEGGTGKVRVLIWEGAVDMLKANAVRTMIGYGPESMYVAYNPYYPPELAHYEARNASPDRSHNETFDALITTGLMGFVVYMFLFASVFYYGLRWLGLIRDPEQKRLFYVCGAVGALLGLLLPLVIEGTLRLAGVGLPMGFAVGISVYATASALLGTTGAGKEEKAQPQQGRWRLLTLAALVSGVLAHFVEIHFGIAIAATRTYFWAYIALMVILGKGLVPVTWPAGSEERANDAKRSAAQGSRRRAKTRRGRRKREPPLAEAERDATPYIESLTAQLVAIAIVVGLVFLTMAWDYTTNPLALSSPVAVIVKSLTTMAARNAPEQTSLGMVWFVLATSVVALLTAVPRLVEDEEKDRGPTWWLSSLGLFSAVAGGVGGLYALIHAASLAPGVNIPDLIYRYYVALFLVWALLVATLYLASPRPAVTARGFSAIGYLLLLLIYPFFIDSANVRIVKADTLYKHGLKYDQARTWDNAVHFYSEAIEVRPKEDFYYLFHGRALMERGKLERDPKVQDAYFTEALKSLKRAKELNPLNTDHTANMARLCRTWAEKESDAASRAEKYACALDHYEKATQLSPHNAQLYNEWGLVHYLMGDLDRAMAKYQESLALDQEFVQTYLLIGDVHLSREEWRQAVPIYEKAVALEGKLVQGWSALGYACSRLREWDKAIEANLEVLRMAPNDYSTLKNLAILHNESGEPQEAVPYAVRALAAAPEQDKATLETFTRQLQARVGKDNP